MGNFQSEAIVSLSTFSWKASEEFTGEHLQFTCLAFEAAKSIIISTAT